ncbi:hypothetical protein MNBD_ALPHA02-365 [hydrothermal vent metagenome]|uniref:DUF1330 domain-containing protein n=1 Tax=hydrothermal vent metagenome TaxID=652676 RepID=A0A3B0RFW4_9ZZZZ
MSAFFIATVTVKDGEKFQEYAVRSKETFDISGGEIVLRGKYVAALTGKASHQAAAIVKFQNMNALDDWYNSKAYQALIPLRDEAADMTIVKYEVPQA